MIAIKKQIANFFQGKKIALLGFGREGKSSLELIRSFHPKQKIEVLNGNTSVIEKKYKNRNTRFLQEIDFKKADYSKYDLVLKSPGIPFSKLPKSLRQGEKLFGQTELFLKWFSYCTIGVTGTKGKSTTSSLIHHVLKQSKIKVLLGGNIGTPLFDLIPMITSKHYVVAEMSCHQLNEINYSPHISILLNLFEEHLDYYKTVPKYFASKLPIFTNQNNQDYLIFNNDSSVIKKFLKKEKVQHTKFSYAVKSSKADYWIKDGILYNKVNRWKSFQMKTKLLGEVNLNNILPSVAVASILRIPKKTIQQAIASFEGLPHRLEYLGSVNDIHFVNDSISTIPEACIEAIKTLKNVGTLFLGGMDRKIDYTELIQYLYKTKIDNLVFFDKAGKRIYNAIKKDKPSFFKKRNILCTSDFEIAIQFCLDETAKNKYCLLSPAASSYGAFKNFEDRGLQFSRYVLKLSKHKKFDN